MTTPTNDVSTARASRAMATLRFTGTRTTHTWLRDLCQSKYVEIAANQKLASCGYRVRFDRTNPRSIW